MSSGGYIFRAAKVRCYPNASQKEIISDTLYCCHRVWNMFCEKDREHYRDTGKSLSWQEFGRFLTKYKKDPEGKWMAKISRKAITEVTRDYGKAKKRFFKTRGEHGHPKFKSRKRNPIRSFYFIRDGVRYEYQSEKKRYPIRVWVPILRFLRIRETGFLPDIDNIVSGRILKENDKFYILLIYVCKRQEVKPSCDGVGIDLGVSNFMTIAMKDGNHREIYIVPSILSNEQYQKNEERIKRLQQVISRKQEINYKRLLNAYMDKHQGELPSEKERIKMKGDSYDTESIHRVRTKINRCYTRRKNLSKNHIDQAVNKIVAIAKPRYIALEDLEIQSMLKKKSIDEREAGKNYSSSTLRDHIAKTNFYSTVMTFIRKADSFGIEVRLVDQKKFPTSQICSSCGYRNRSLLLSDREYLCPECGLTVDRDVNAALNILSAKKKYYHIAGEENVAS